MSKKSLFLLSLIFTSLTVHAASFSLNHDKAVNYFKSDQEPKVIDAVWTADDIFKVGVFDNGTSRNGYAQYVCMALSDFGFKNKGVWVQVIDYRKLINDGSWKRIGEAHCR